MSSLGTPATIGLLYQLQITDEYAAFGEKRTGRGNRSTQRKPVPVPFCPPQIPHDFICDRTRAAAVGCQRIMSFHSGSTLNIRWAKIYAVE
jgi:hypothetical protein